MLVEDLLKRVQAKHEMVRKRFDRMLTGPRRDPESLPRLAPHA